MSRRAGLGLLLLLAALLPVRAEASRTSVWASNPPATVLARTDEAGLLAPLAPAGSLENSIANADLTEPPRFDLGDVALVESELEHEDRFGLGPLDLLGPTPLRGPPSSYPETRVRGFELLPPFRIGASASLSLWPRQACGFSCREVVSDSPEDPWGLATVKKTAQVYPQKSCPVPANPTGYPGVCDAFVPAFVVEAAGVPVSRDANEYGRDLRRSGAGADDVQALRNLYDTSGGNRARIAAAAKGAETARPVADAAAKGIVVFGTVMSGTLAGEAGALTTIGSGREMAEAAVASRIGSLEGGAVLQERARELNSVRGYMASRGTTAAARVRNTVTGEEQTWLATESEAMPKQWTGKVGENEFFVEGPGHAEETIFGALGDDWMVVEGGTSRNICKSTCSPAAGENGLTIGGPTFRGRADKTRFRIMWNAGP